MPVGNPLVNALMVAVGLVAIGAMLVLGIVAFLIVASILVVLAGIVGLRLWWIGRKLRKAAGAPAGPSRTHRIIEGEYRRVPTGAERERHERHGGD